MRKIFTFLCAALMSVGMFATTEVTITDSDFPARGDSFTKDGVTVSAGRIDGQEGNIMRGGSFSTNLGNFTQIEVNAADVYTLGGDGWSGNLQKKTWTGNASSVSFSGEIMGMGMGITLKFTIEDPAPTTYTLQLVADPAKGSVAVTNLLGSDIIDNGNGNYTVPENAEVTILATPLEGYEFTGWKEGNIGEMVGCYYCGTAVNTEDNPYTFTMTADVAYLAEFAAVAPTPATTVTWNSSTVSSIGLCDGQSFTKDGVTLTVLNGVIDGEYGEWMGNSDDASFKFSTSLGNFTKIEITATIYELGGSGWTQTSPGAVWTGEANETIFGKYFENVSQIVFTIGEGEPTGVENVQTNQVQATKFFRDGQLLIEKNGKIYNATGAEVK